MTTDRMTGVRQPITDIPYGAFATKRSKKGSSSFATPVGLSTSPHATTQTLNRCSWNFMLCVLKIPIVYQLLINYTTLTGCFFYRGNAAWVWSWQTTYICDKLRMHGAILPPFHTSPGTDI